MDTEPVLKTGLSTAAGRRNGTRRFRNSSIALAARARGARRLHHAGVFIPNFPDCDIPQSMAIDMHDDYPAWFVELVKGPAFASTRWSDGEWLCAAGRLGGDSNGGSTTEMCPSVLRDLLDQGAVARTYSFAKMSWLCKNQGIRAAAEQVLAGIPQAWRPRFVPYVYSDNLIHSEPAFRAFLAEVRGKCIIVGPHHFAGLRPELLACGHHVVLPCCNQAYDARESIYEELRAHADALSEGRGFVLVAAGLASKTFVTALAGGSAAGGLGTRHTVLDVGSMFDAFAGVTKKGEPLKAGNGKVKFLCEAYPEYMPPEVCSDLVSGSPGGDR